ncbi:MAG: hypothetical protein K0Q99_262 [Clostridia bacterium]|jgi:hypothetical protein|nr:hypothetical protein [Clostridia bacterium]
MKKYKIVNKYRFFGAISLIMVILFATMFFMVVNAKSTSNVALVPVYVGEGDNLWQLSIQHSDGKIDIRDYIANVISINNLSDSNIKPGELIMFPHYND